MRRWPALLTGFSLLLGNFCMAPLAAAATARGQEHHAAAPATESLMTPMDAMSCPYVAQKGAEAARHASSCGGKGTDCLLKSVQKDVGILAASTVIPLPYGSLSTPWDSGGTALGPLPLLAAGPPPLTTRTVILQC